MNNNSSFFDFITNSPPLIELIWFLSGIFLLSILTLILYLKFLRRHLRSNDKASEIYRMKYELHLITYLYATKEGEEISAEQQEIINKIKSDLSSPFKRSIVVATLLKLKDEISGELDESIQKLYIQTGLIDFAKAKLRSKKWNVVALGVRELTQFHIEEVHDEITALIIHPKNEVRKEMQLYLVNLFSFKGLAFLEKLESTLSEWDQIQLLEVLQRFDDQQVFDITPWLRSSNNSVVLFALKLADIYIQFQAKDDLINLLTHNNHSIRVETIKVLSNLNVYEAKAILKNNFNEQSLEEQIAFFKMMDNLFDNEDESFILENIRHKNFEIKHTALKILKILNLDTYNTEKQIQSEPDFIKIVNFLESN